MADTSQSRSSEEVDGRTTGSMVADHLTPEQIRSLQDPTTVHRYGGMLKGGPQNTEGCDSPEEEVSLQGHGLGNVGHVGSTGTNGMIGVGMLLYSGSSMLSNDESIDGQGGETLETINEKKGELYSKLQKLKECEKFLKAQLALQKEKLKLEQQEKENFKLEQDLKRWEELRVIEQCEEARIADLESQRIVEVQRLQEHEHQMERDRLVVEWEERKHNLQHQSELEKLQTEQWEQEKCLHTELLANNKRNPLCASNIQNLGQAWLQNTEGNAVEGPQGE